jgi:Rrf2 family protein
VQILNELRSKGLIQSRRGKTGGYNLARPPSEITVGDVLRALDGEVVELSALAGTATPREIQRVWDQLKQRTEEVVDGVTFAQLCEEAKLTPAMYYI